jgi:hypothetical protein
MQARVLIGVAAAVMALAGTAQAQGKGKGKDKHDERRVERHEAKRDDDHDRDHDRDERRRNGSVVRSANGDITVVPGNGRKIPPGLAKKPGQMPPGQYKKIYGTQDGANVLSDIFRRRGYTVTRLVPYGESRYVYYRGTDGNIRRAIVSPGADRLSFSNVPAAILQEVLARLY